MFAEQRPAAGASPVDAAADGEESRLGDPMIDDAMVDEVTIGELMRGLDSDATPAAAAQLIGLATDYFESTRRGEGPVSSGRPPNEIAPRFDEPLPENGQPLEAVVARIRTDVLTDANRLGHP